MASETIKRVRLGEVCNVLDSMRKPITKQDRVAGPVPYYGATCVQDHVRDYIFDEPLVLLGEDGARWGADERSAYMISGKAWVNNHAHVLRPGAELDRAWLTYYLCHTDLNCYITGTTVRKLTQDKMRNIELPLPPLPAQRRIAAALDKISEMKRNAEARLQKLDLLVKARFSEMFGDPISNSKNLPEIAFEKVVRLQRGFDLPVQNRDEKGCVPIYGSNGMLGFHSEFRACDGVVTGRSGTIGNVYCIKGKYWPLNTSLFSVETHGNDVVYLTWLLRLFKLERFSAGTGVPTLNRNDVHRQKIIEVGVAEQRSFAAFVEKVEALKATAQASLARVDLLYRAKLQEYFG